MTFQIRPAVRTAANPLIGLYGLSGTGKTFSALLLARGLVGPQGRIVMIDTESGRGELYADVIDGGYGVIPLGEPFSPDRYIEAFKAAEQSGADVIIIDSGSHIWEGTGGVTDWAASIQERTGKAGLHCWKDPKMAHQKFVLALLRSKTPVIVCLRAKYKSRQGKNPKTGKTEIIRDEHATPIQSAEFIFEMTVHAEILQDHTLNVTKISHPDLASVFESGKMLSIDTGKALSEWAKGDDRASAGNGVSGNGNDELHRAAREVASLGKKRFREYYKTLAKPDRAVVAPIMDELKAITEAADKGALDRDDPFAGDASEESSGDTVDTKEEAAVVGPLTPFAFIGLDGTERVCDDAEIAAQAFEQELDAAPDPQAASNFADSNKTFFNALKAADKTAFLRVSNALGDVTGAVA